MVTQGCFDLLKSFLDLFLILMCGEINIMIGKLLVKRKFSMQPVSWWLNVCPHCVHLCTNPESQAFFSEKQWYKKFYQFERSFDYKMNCSNRHFSNLNPSSCLWCYTPVIPAYRMLRQDCHGFKASFFYVLEREKEEKLKCLKSACWLVLWPLPHRQLH